MTTPERKSHPLAYFNEESIESFAKTCRFSRPLLWYSIHLIEERRTDVLALAEFHDDGHKLCFLTLEQWQAISARPQNKWATDLVNQHIRESGAATVLVDAYGPPRPDGGAQMSVIPGHPVGTHVAPPLPVIPPCSGEVIAKVDELAKTWPSPWVFYAEEKPMRKPFKLTRNGMALVWYFLHIHGLDNLSGTDAEMHDYGEMAKRFRYSVRLLDKFVDAHEVEPCCIKGMPAPILVKMVRAAREHALDAAMTMEYASFAVPEGHQIEGMQLIPGVEPHRPCHCGSGKKFMHCHGRKARAAR